MKPSFLPFSKFIFYSRIFKIHAPRILGMISLLSSFGIVYERPPLRFGYEEISQEVTVCWKNLNYYWNFQKKKAGKIDFLICSEKSKNYSKNIFFLQNEKKNFFEISILKMKLIFPQVKKISKFKKLGFTKKFIQKI